MSMINLNHESLELTDQSITILVASNDPYHHKYFDVSIVALSIAAVVVWLL